MVKTKNKYGAWSMVMSRTSFLFPYKLHRPNLYLALFFFCLITNLGIGHAQDIDFTLRYNTTDDQYEVFGKSNNSYPNFFVGGGSQLSIILPANIPNNALIINTVTGGLWTDNSQIFAPAATPEFDYHGIASNGSFMNWEFGKEILLFTFSIPNETCVDGIRLFDNAHDPNSSEPSMNGADFQNYFANVLTFVDHYRENYNNSGTSCGVPSVFINPITTPINTGGESCGSIINVDPNTNHTATICQQPTNGTTSVSIDNSINQICLNFSPNTDFTGQDSVCVEICDENDICIQAMVLLNVFGGNNNNPCDNQATPIVNTNSPICSGGQIELSTTDFGADYSYTWTNANNETIGQSATLSIASTNSQAISPYKVTRTATNCTPVSSLPINVSVIDFSLLTVENNGPICVGNPVKLKANGLEGGIYRWFVVSSNTPIATGSNPTINNLETTTTYRLEATLNGCQNTNILETTVSVDPKPNISNLERTITVCRGEDVQITPVNTPSTGEEIRYIWTGPNDFRFKDNVINDQFPLVLEDISPEQAGAYSIEITSKNGCEVDSRSIIINVVDELEAPILTSSEQLVCSGSQIEITATEQDDATIEFEWFIQLDNDETTFLQTSTQPTLLLEDVTSSNSGKYLVRTTKNGCVSGFSNTIVITVFDMFSTVEATNNGPICPGEAVQLAASAIPDAVYNWYQNGNLVATGQSPTINNITETTEYELVVTLSNCQTELTGKTTVSIASGLTIINLTETIGACIGSEIKLSAQNTPAQGQEITYTWTGPNNFQFTGTTTNDSFELTIPSINPSKSGAYSLSLSTNDGCATDNKSVLVNVNNELSAPTLIPVTNVVCGNNAIELTASLQDDANVKFEWYIQNATEELFLLDVTNVPSIIFENATAVNSGKYLVRVRKGNCISGFSNTEVITVLDESSNLPAANSTSLTNRACEGDFVQLSVPFIEGATYKWFGPNDFASDTYNPFINQVNQSNAGDYFAVINIGGCTGIISTPTRVYVNENFVAPSISGDTLLCEGEDLILEIMSTITSDNDESPTVTWYNAITNQVIETTNDNRLQIRQASAANSGSYYATISVNGCESPPSNNIEVTVVNRTNLIAYAGKDEKLCTAGSINLEALAVAHTVGNWSSPTGAIISNPTAVTTSATNLIAGENLFVWSIMDVCGQTATDTLFINIIHTTDDVANAGIDQNICEEGTIKLNATALAASTGLWTQELSQANQGIVITNATDPKTTVEGLIPGNTYQFIWALSTRDCPDFMLDEVFISVNEIPEEIAFISEENANISICEGAQVRLVAETPLFSTGRWTTASNAVIVNPSLPETMAGDVPFGEQTFIWTLSNEACGDFSSDTLQVYRETSIEANSDTYTISLDDSITFNLLDNDIYNDFENLRLTITKFPEKGTLRDDGNGQFTFFSERTIFGEDNFRYKLCSNFCESVCDTAIVDINILGSGANNDCFITNVITPNGDGVNDQFLIGCLSNFPDAQVKVFNRWGDVIYAAAPYSNDWEGTHKGKPLPAGTYFYTLVLEPGNDPIEEFITIFR